MNGALVPTEIVSKSAVTTGASSLVRRASRGVKNATGRRMDDFVARGKFGPGANTRRRDVKTGRRQGAAVGLAAGYGFDRASGGHDRRVAFRQVNREQPSLAQRYSDAEDGAEVITRKNAKGRTVLGYDDKTNAKLDAADRAHRRAVGGRMRQNEISKNTAGYLVRRAKMVQKASKLARTKDDTPVKRTVGAVRRATLTEKPGGPQAFAAGSLATLAFAPGRDGAEAKRRQAGNGKISKVDRAYVIAGGVGGAAGGVLAAHTKTYKRRYAEGYNKAQAKQRAKQAISKDWAIPIVHHSTRQSRNPLGRFASADNHFTLDHGADLTTRRAAAVHAEGRGRGGLAPAMTRRASARPANSNSPNGAGHGRRLA